MSFKKIYSLLALCVTFSAHGAFVDSDTYCINYGCVVVSDNNTSNVYDVYTYSGTASVPVGSQLNFYTSNPVEGSGAVDPLFTNTTTNISTLLAGDAPRIRINNQIGGGVVTHAAGVLDAAASVTKFGIGSNTTIEYGAVATAANVGDSPQSHSFYISSRNVRFNIRANAVMSGTNGEFAVNVPGSTIDFVVNMTKTGTTPTAFGANTSANPQFNSIAGLKLANLTSNPVVAFFDAAIYGTANANASIYTKSVRLDTRYTLPDFDLSQGNGEMRWGIVFSFWRK